MEKKYGTTIFIFRRDLRLNDNIGLIAALSNSKVVLPIFIFTPEQLVKNSYKSDNCVQFMIESLEDLNYRLKKYNSKLFYFYGEPYKVINKILKKESIDAIFINMDYTPYAIKRDNRIKKICKKHKIDFIINEDYLLLPIHSIRTKQNTIYSKFTPYFRKAVKIKIDSIKLNKKKNYVGWNKKIVEFDGDIHKFYTKNKYICNQGGRKYGLQKLVNIHKFKDYNKNRNCLNYKTTNLSAYIKFGCVSIREVYHAIKKKLGINNELIKQLYWREFYINIAYKYPKVFGNNLKLKYDKINWSNDRTLFNKWKNANTGYPIVDACMNEMNTTGFMHNRGRLIVASFLVKILMINWQWGEKYFAQTLHDYSPIINNGNWQWVAGTGADSQPYFRIFNPWLQAKEYDPNCIYIKKWIPELKDIENKHIHSWYKYNDKYKINYPKPIVDYVKKKKKALNMYKKIYD